MTRVHAGRGSRVVPVLLPLVGLLLLSPHSSASVDPSFAGTVRSSVGALLEGVEVLVVAQPAAMAPVAAATTDHQGRFRIARLSPGVYRVAALKRGYASFVGDVDTRLERWIELILSPQAGLSEERSTTLPDDASWALRLPRRHILQQTEASVVDADDEAARLHAASSSPGPPEDTLSMQVDQLFAVGASLAPRRPEDPILRGVETRIRLASLVGERGRIQVRGHRESLDAASASRSPEPAASTSDDAAGVRFAFAYDTGVDGQVTVDAFYRERDLRWNPSIPGAAGSLKQEQRSWGGRSGWSRQLDPASRLAVSLDYQDAALRRPHEPADRLSTAGVSPVVNRSVRAAGTYDTVRSDGHQLQVDFKARFLNTSLPSQRLATSWPGSFTGVEGFTVGLQARDTWRLTGPFSLVYGLGYNHSLRLSDSSLIVPQLGGSWSFDAAALSVLLSYHAVTDWSDGKSVDSVGTFRPAEDLGYETRLDLPLTRTLRLTGSRSYTPIQFEFVGRDETTLGAERIPLYLTDGNAAVHRNRVALVRAAGNTQTYAELAQGRAEGTLAAVLPYEIPFQDLSQRRLRYLNGRVGIRIVPAGTHLIVEYRQVDERLAAELAPEHATQQRSLELSLIQDLMRRQDLGNWRLLMGVRMASLETDSGDWLATGNETIVEALGGRLRAGLSVEF